MTEPIIICPQCKNQIKLTESLAAPLIESTRRQYEQRLSQKDLDIASREKAVLAQQDALARDRQSLDAQVAEKVERERTKIATDEARKAKLALANDLNQKTKEVADLQEILQQRDKKLAEAQRTQAGLLKKQRELDDAKRELDLTIEKRVQEALVVTRQQARREVEDELKLKVMEKEQTIAAMQKQIEDLKRKAEQGSQQLQGEVLELQIESMLHSRFPHDLIEPVAKGEHGGDILHRVVTPGGVACGTILWESKRTRNWSDAWLGKLREDQRAAKADIAVVVSAVLPKGVDTFDHKDGIWITHPRALLPVALSLRQTLIEVNCARQATEGQQTKMELMYQYLTGPKFRLRVQAIVESFTDMAEDLHTEKKAIMKQWSKREEQIGHMLAATVSMYGELQGIAGKTLKEIEGLDMKLLGHGQVTGGDTAESI